MSDIFGKSTGYAGFYGPEDSGDLELMIARGESGGTNVIANEGFLADGYTIDWGRAVSIKRVFNNDKPIAIVGHGQGTVNIQGLIGTKEGFEAIVGTSGSTKQDLCTPLTITIKSGSPYNSCSNAGDAKAVALKLTGCVLSRINVQGSINTDNGTRLQQANVVFNIGGFSVE